jgi:hypothetical protein
VLTQSESELSDSPGLLVTADTNQSQGLAEQLRDGLAFKRWGNEIECAVILRGLKCFRLVGGPNEHHASGNGGTVRNIDEVSPRTVRELDIGKDQVRMGLLEEENRIRLGPDTEGINTQAPEHKFERLARLRAVVNHESERFGFHGIYPPLQES